jgi:hypothetical protein
MGVSSMYCRETKDNITHINYERYRKLIRRSIITANTTHQKGVRNRYRKLISHINSKNICISSSVDPIQPLMIVNANPNQQLTIVNEDQRPLFICKQSHTDFPTVEKLESHQCSCDQIQEKLDEVTKQMKDLEEKDISTTKQMKDVEEERVFSQRLREADDEENSVYHKDLKMAAIIFMVGFVFEQSKNKKMQAEAYLDALFPKNSYIVSKVRRVGKGDSNHHVSLSTSDAAYKLFSDYRRLLPRDNQRDILKVTSPETAVRFKILAVIAIKLDKSYGTNKPYVDYINIKPHLFVFKEGSYKQYRFSAAIQKFRTVIDQSDLGDVRKFAFSKNLKGATLKQFIVL